MGYAAIHLSGNEKYDGTKSGFETSELAWAYIAEHRCDLCLQEIKEEEA